MNYPIVETLRLDPMPTASMVEAVVGDYLVPPEPGIYFRGKASPLMRQGQVYHQHKWVNGQKSKETFVVKTIEELDRRFPVMDLDANVVITPNQIPFLTYMPVLPVTALRIVKEAVQSVLDLYGAKPGTARSDRLTHQYPSEPFETWVVPNESDPDYLVQITDQIMGIVAEIRTKVREFCGDDYWIMHFFKESHGTFIIEKSIDWRILEYHRITGTRYE